MVTLNSSGKGYMGVIEHICVYRKGVSRRRPPIYRVMLHNDNFNKREYVVRVLLKVIDELTVDDAVNVMQVIKTEIVYVTMNTTN